MQRIKSQKIGFKTFLVLMLIGIVATATVTYSFAAGTFYINPWTATTEASYIIFKSDSTYYARNGQTGAISYSGTDASTVIQAALNGLTSGRTWKEKVSLKGEFTISTSITVSSYTIIDLTGARLWLENGKNTYILKLVGDYIDVVNGEIDGNKANQSATASGGRTSGIWIAGSSSNILINMMFIHDCYNNGIFTYSYSDIINVTTSNSQIENNGYAGFDAAFPGFGEGYNFLLVHNIFKNNALGAFALGFYGEIRADFNKSRIIGNYFEGAGGFGITLYGVKNIISENTIIGRTDGNDLGEYYQAGIQVYVGTHDNVIDANYIEGCSQGISLSMSNHNIVSDNVAKNNLLHGTQAGCGIELNGGGTGASCTYNIIVNNQFFDDQLIHTQEYGIYNLVNGGTIGNNVYIGNILLSNTEENALILGTGNIIKDNVGFVTENSGTATISASTSVTFNHGLAGTPDHVECGFKTTGYGSWIWSASSTQITIIVTNSGTYDFSWYAEYNP